MHKKNTCLASANSNIGSFTQILQVSITICFDVVQISFFYYSDIEWLPGGARLAEQGNFRWSPIGFIHLLHDQLTANYVRRTLKCFCLTLQQWFLGVN